MNKDILPDSWIKTHLSEICSINPKVKLADDLDVGFMPMADMPKSYFGKTKHEVRKWDNVKKGFTQFKDGDTLFAKITPCFENSKAAIISDFPNSWGAGSTEYYVLRPYGQLVDPKLLFALVKTKDFLLNGAANMSGSVGHRRVPKDYVENYEFPLIPLAEQKQIATQLDQLLSQVNTLKNRLDNIPNILKRFRQSVLAAAVSGKLTEEWRENNNIEPINLKELFKEVKNVRKELGFRESKIKNIDLEELPFSIPKEWSWVRLGGVALKITDGAHNTPKVRHEGYPYLMAKNLTKGFLDFSENRFISEKDHQELFNKCRPEVGDLLVVNIGAGTGNNVLVNIDYEFSFKNIAIIKRPSFIAPKYLKWFFDARKEIIFNEQTRGGAQPFLSLTMLNSLEVALPSIDEQTEIVCQVEKFFNFSDKIEKQVNVAQTRVNNLTQSILAKAFRGELTAEWREQNQDLISGENSAAALLEKIKVEKEALKSVRKVKRKKVA